MKRALYADERPGKPRSSDVDDHGEQVSEVLAQALDLSWFIAPVTYRIAQSGCCHKLSVCLAEGAIGAPLAGRAEFA